jgi:hypothetical protein
LALSTWTSSFAVAAPRAIADHTDERVGFRIGTPRGWSSIPLRVDERWIVAKYLSDKSDHWNDESGWTVDHRPEMHAIAFVSEAIKARPKVTKKENKKGETEILVEYESPFKDYKDFMARRYTGGGYHIASEEETKVGDVSVTTLEIKVERGSREGPKRIITWIYHVPDVDLAVHFECLEDAYPKLKSEFQRCLRSFRAIPRSGASLFEASTPGRRLTFLDLEELTPDERKVHKAAMEREAHEKASANVPDGWTVKKIGRFLVINHTDDKYAKKVVEQAEAVWQYLEANFAFIGPGEYVRSPIIRICKDFDEEKTYYTSQGDWTWNNLEIFTHKDYGGSNSWEMEWVNRRVAELWFEDRDRTLYWSFPQWLDAGLDQTLGQARSKNGRIDFKSDAWDREDVREAAREGRALAPRELMNMSGEDFFQDYVHRQEAGALVAFFLTGAASKNKQTKDVLTDYLKNLKSVVDAVEKEADASAGKKKDGEPKTEEDEDEAFKSERQAWKQREKRIMEEVWHKTFSGWTDFEWKRFEEIYFKAIN